MIRLHWTVVLIAMDPISIMKFVILNHVPKYKSSANGHLGFKIIAIPLRMVNIWRSDSDLCANRMEAIRIVWKYSKQKRRIVCVIKMVRVIGSVKMMIWVSENGHRGAIVCRRVKELVHEPVWLPTNWMAIIVKVRVLNMKHVKWIHVTVSCKCNSQELESIINFHEIFRLL